MSFQVLHTNLVTLIDGISEIQEVQSTPTFQFSGFPSAFVAESGSESAFQSSQDNLRVYAFNVWVFQEFDVTSPANAYAILRQTIDTLIDKIDAEESPEGTQTMAVGLDTGKTLVAVMATPSEFVYDENEKMLASRVLVKCKVLVDLTSID